MDFEGWDIEAELQTFVWSALMEEGDELKASPLQCSEALPYPNPSQAGGPPNAPKRENGAAKCFPEVFPQVGFETPEAACGPLDLP